MNKHKEEIDRIDSFLQWSIFGVCLFLAVGILLAGGLTSSVIILSLLLGAQAIIICPLFGFPVWSKIGFSIFTYLMIFA
ncbi:hypothetical protein [Gloeothece verrucosa]|uniref:Uncharacterized protein n=1 Tax=Gloeothece verrucosa (strain PCC 7822) TaxID=497965 RepID=E0UNR9_GLOV7|nr:hypothetical protein [Gloeothece verrucosa]ADN18599.1 hypothetical protein Cyan7822_6961 [Gloeothece verrucosa PCC 7822]